MVPIYAAGRTYLPPAGAGQNITNKAQPLSVFYGGITAIRPARALYGNII